MFLFLAIKGKRRGSSAWMNLTKRELAKFVPKMSSTVRKSTIKMISSIRSMTLREIG